MNQQIDSMKDAHRGEVMPKAACIVAGRTGAGFAPTYVLLVLSLLLSVLAGSALLGATAARAETRTLKMYYTHTKESINVTFKRNGKYDKRGLRKLNRFLRDFRRNEPTRMDPALFDLVWEVYKKSGSRKRIHVISGYRSPKTNNMLRRRGRNVAKKSQHTLGKALDFFLPDVSVEKLRALGLKAHRGGVGYYRGSFVHLDTGRVRHWPRMSHRQLAKVFPRGRTIHIPSNGKPLKGYKTAMANLKKGRNADGSRRGSAVKTSLLARLFSRSGNDGDEDEGNVAPRPARKPVKPKPVQVAKIPAPKPVLPKARSGPNVFVSEASALKDSKSQAAHARKAEQAKLAARIAAESRRALEQKRAADLARAVEKPVEENLIATLRPENTPRPVRRPRANVGADSTLTALAPAAPVEAASPAQLALASPPVPATRVLRPRADVPETAKAVSSEQTASVRENLLKPVVEIESISRPEPEKSRAENGGDGFDEGTLVAVANGAVPTDRPQRAPNSPAVSKQQLAALAESVTSVVTSGNGSTVLPAAPDALPSALPRALPQARPDFSAGSERGQEVAALEPASPVITEPTEPSWRDGADKAPILAGVSDTDLARLPRSTAQPVAAIAVSSAATLEPALSIGDLESRSMKRWAVATSTRVGPAVKLRAPHYSQSIRHAVPGAVYSEGFDRGLTRWRADRFSGHRPMRLAFIDKSGSTKP